MRRRATPLGSFPWDSGYPRSEAGAPAEGSGNPEFRAPLACSSLGGTKTGGGAVGEAPWETSQEGRAGRIRGASRALIVPHPSDSVSASSLQPIHRPMDLSYSLHPLESEGWSRASREVRLGSWELASLPIGPTSTRTK